VQIVGLITYIVGNVSKIVQFRPPAALWGREARLAISLVWQVLADGGQTPLRRCEVGWRSSVRTEWEVLRMLLGPGSDLPSWAPIVSAE
jgi:hypothetical protein